MSLDLQLTKLGLKMRNLIVLDVEFPHSRFPEFKKAYLDRYIHIPCRKEMALEMAAGLSSFGKIVAVCGLDCDVCDLPDQTLNVKVLRGKKDAVWDYFEGELMEFGPGVIFVPQL